MNHRHVLCRLRPAARAFALPAALLCGAAAAQQTVIVTGSASGQTAASQPSSVLSGEGLVLRRAGSLGETLDGLPGVAATAFGPNASRPVIRGLDGDRVRLLDNGGASIDASNLSFDHASATDPLVAERIEVLRGPAALLYGGNATGGVVNSVDNRIPRVPASALGGRAEVRFGGAAAERSGAVVLEGGRDGGSGGGNDSGQGGQGGKGGIGGDGGLAWHVDASGRQARDLRVPRFTPVEDGSALDPATRVRNSAARSEGGAVGAGFVSSRGYLGASLETARNHYGVTAEPDVFIRMQRDRLALAGELRAITGPITQVSALASRTRYHHDEVEGSGAVGTTFKSRGDELRLQAQHAPLGAMHGTFGLLAETLRFSALGEEAFVPDTRTRSSAVFALEELALPVTPFGPALLSAGARIERVTVASSGDAAGAAEPRFGAAAERRFTPASASLAARIGAAQGWHAGMMLGRTERAPAYYELYANGLHVATAAFERGDAALPVERSTHAELDAGFADGPHMVKASVFTTRFARFIALDATGNRVDDAPEYAFRAVRARMRGIEIDARTRLADAPLSVDLTGGFDLVRGDNLDSGEPLPRLVPWRLRTGVDVGRADWRAGATLRYAARQGRVSASDSVTPGYTLLDFWASGKLGVAALGARGFETLWFARLSNATDRLAYSASTIATVRGLAPLPGRALTVGLRTRF